MIRKGIGQRFTLGKNDRLKSRKLIAALFTAGKSFNAYPLKALYKFTNTAASPPSALVPLQAGFTVSSKTFKRSVDRNRIKRLMREAYRLQKNDIRELVRTKQKSLILFFIYTGKEMPDLETITIKTTAVLSAITREVQT